ncbi:hypothetical protein EJ05DRAFT_479112 [Pseudovirgaria hyperparasitica]|uniref:Putative gamma-glutamylcyclotransferase n=1 Tax=Pseudovirgaria hyperparasitica TaxID=470096 RepID=A0A6A6W0S0_9PEZI|nr:uncharacterized protein EJ05DRAFT_479112 [Pseudovirgaria hyperparasitica]KAF2754671.1 hypothetical protein EJ05DRAFT_479112 [Pseudovirgaria hyperparasitica]
MASHSAFFYGTLMAPAVLHRVIHGSSNPQPWQRDLLTIRPAMLYGHHRHRVAHADYPAVIPSSEPKACVRGTLVTGLTEGDLWRLDIFEGDEYERRNIRAKILVEEDGESVETDEVEAQTYIWIAGESLLDETEWDFDEFVRDKMSRWVGAEGDGEYAGRPSIIEVDEAVKAQDTDPTRGRGLNGNITRALQQHSKSNGIVGSAT